MKTSDDNQHENQSIYSLLMQLMFTTKHRIAKFAERFDLSVMQSNALNMLDADEPKAMRMLSDYFMCDASTITGLADRLEARGLITRENHPTDRRIKLVTLTDEGAALKATIQAEIEHIETERLTSILTESERETLRELLAKILAAQSAN